MRALWKRFKHGSVVLLLRLFRLGFACLPIRVGLWLGDGVGRAAVLFAPNLRRRADVQLEDALKLGTEEVKDLRTRVFAHLGRLGAELLLLPRLSRDLPRFVDLPPASIAVLRKALEEGGPAAIAVTAHLGNWELLAQRIAAEGFEISAAARANPNPVLGRWLVHERTRGGVKTLERGRSALGLRQALRSRGFIAFLIDQDTRVPSVFVPFFGRPAKTPSVPAELAVKRDLPVVLGLIFRDETGHHVEVTRIEHHDLGGSEAERVEALTARLTAGIEAGVRAHPEQWVWVHARWKTPPA